jgi:Txe/YoeB family toxin of toxin-antitoxin system
MPVGIDDGLTGEVGVLDEELARDNAQALLDLLADDPLRSPPPFEKLVGDLAGAYSRRINIQHRLVYQFLKGDHTVKVLRMWSHYE